MRLVPVNEISPGMKLAKPIYYDTGILLNSGIKNLPKYSKRLLEKGINYIYVEDKFSSDIEVDDVVKEKTRRKCKKVIKDTLENISFNKKIEIKEVENVVNQIVNDIYNSKDILLNLVDIKSYDSYTFDHSVNVAVLSILMGNSLNYNKSNLIKLGIGAILHDIGKTLIPEGILTKKEKLTDNEFDIIKKHPRLGYDYLKGNNNISPVSKNPILYHHERMDGNGYPKKLPGNELHDFAKIVGITDVFDALTSDRVYRNRWPIHKAINYLMSNTNEKFDLEYIKKFIR